jgi:hypothetical protein
MPPLSLVLSALLLNQAPAEKSTAPPAAPAATSPSTSVRAKLLELYLDEAQDFHFLRRGDEREKLALREEPIYVWSNPLVANGQYGAVYVWSWQGRPDAVGTIFVYNVSGPGDLWIMHEFHSLSPEKLSVARQSGRQMPWQPQAGVELTPLDDGPTPAAKPAARLVQMRSLAREFSVSTVNLQGERWELRLLPQPLFRYDRQGDAPVDGALFAFVTSAGTDPELMLMIETRATDAGLRWQYAPLRFTLFDLTVERNGKEVWKSLNADLKQSGHNPDDTYHVYRERTIPPIADDAAASTERPKQQR